MEKARNEKRKFLFTVDILMEGYNNGIALENLLHLLNQDTILDYDIRKGISLGETIAASAKLPAVELPIPRKAQSAPSAPSDKMKEPLEVVAVSLATEKDSLALPPSSADAAPRKPRSADARSAAGPELIQLVENYKSNNSLVRLTVLKGKGIRLSLPCRIVSFDPDMDMLTVYHVDEKKVYQFHMTEVEDFSV
jgi:hypothetical protein